MNSNCNLIAVILLCLSTAVPGIVHSEQELPKENISTTGQPLPNFLIGKWVVTKADINKTIGEVHLGPWKDDPRYVGRVFYFDPDKVNSTLPEIHKDCTRPSIRSEKMTVTDLFKYGMEDNLAPSDFEIPVEADSVIPVYRVECSKELWYSGLMRPDEKKPKIIDGPWIIELPNKKIGIRWIGALFLTLERLPANAEPSPSFYCHQAKTPSEKAICKSVELALYDESVSNSFSRILGLNDPAKTNRLKTTQKKWIKERDKCGTDQECLRKSMTDRLEEIWGIRNDLDIEEPHIPLCEPKCP